MIRTVTANAAHALNLATRLSELDKQEVEIYTPGVPYDERLLLGVHHSFDASALIDGDNVLAIWGVIDARNHWGDVFGAPWLLSAGKEEYSMSATRMLLEATRASVASWKKEFDTLLGFSWAGAHEHHKLLRKLGFELKGPRTEAADTGREIPPTMFFAMNSNGSRYFV